MAQTPLPFGHRSHAPSARYESGPPYAYGSCGAPPDQANSGTGSHHHATGTGPAAQSSRPTDFQRLPTQFHLCVAPPRPGFDKHGNVLAGYNGRQGADAGYGYQRADDHQILGRPGTTAAAWPTQHGQPQQCSGSYTEDTAAAWQTQDSQPQPQKCRGSYTDDFNPPLTYPSGGPDFDIHGYALAGYSNFAEDRQRADDDRQRAAAEHQRTIEAEQAMRAQQQWVAEHAEMARLQRSSQLKISQLSAQLEWMKRMLQWRVANAATAELSGEQDKPGAELEQNAAKPSGAPFEPEQHAAAAEPGSTLEQHAAAAEPRPPLAPQPGEPSERDYTVAAQPGEDPGHAVSAVADPDPEGPGPSGAPLEMAINVPDALDAAAERALAAARPALDFAAEANAPAVRRSLPPGFVPKKPCFIRCPSCFDKSCPGTFSSKTCVVYAATEPIAAAEPEGAPDEPEQRVAIAAAVAAEPGSVPVEPEQDEPE